MQIVENKSDADLSKGVFIEKDAPNVFPSGVTATTTEIDGVITTTTEILTDDN